VKIFYGSPEGNRSCLVAALIHLGKLPECEIPKIMTLISLFKGFDGIHRDSPGIPGYLGKDCDQNDIYTLGLGKDPAIVFQAICHILQKSGNPGNSKFYPILENDPFLRLGGFLARRLGLVAAGRLLKAVGIRRSYFGIAKLVGQVKEMMGMKRRRVVVLTDGDRVAQNVVKKVARNIGGRAISLSGGNPTRATGEEIAAAVKQTPHDPVLVMIDDCGASGKGRGEQALEKLAATEGIDLLGAVAVASNTAAVEGTAVDASVTRDGNIVESPVNKDGTPQGGQAKLHGDTVDVLKQLDIPVVIGVGDLGKMNDADLVEQGAKITTQAVKEVLRRSGATSDSNK
jgi:stage V sporulation protein AE